MFTEERFEQAQIETDKLLQLINIAAKSILDLGCGPGRFSIPLAIRGCMFFVVRASSLHDIHIRQDICTPIDSLA
jgi:2-polyprenyl-3-methyl-5-hydroxy-6-metoxy-1,4-benzoquinol methylase